MNVLADTWRGLVQRRLWPVALLLLAAAAAVPLLLAKGEEPIPNVPVAATPETGEAADAQSIVAVASSAQRELGRDVVGSRKDPFRPAIKAQKAKAPETTSSSSGAATPTDTGSSGGGGSAGGGSGGMTPVTPTAPVTPTTPVTPTKRYEVATIAVRWGSTSSGSSELINLRRLKALPSVEQPVLIYLGLRRDNKTAVFMVDAGAVVQGDGRCLPSPQNCQTLELTAGETEFIDMTTDAGVAQYQLDFVKVRRKKVTAKQARRAYSATAAGGKEVLKSRWGRLGRWRYNDKTGHIRQIGDRAYAADVQRYQERFGG